MCTTELFSFLGTIQSFFWGYIGFTMVVAAGIYFTVRSNFYQFKVLAHPLRTIKAVQVSAVGGTGISPFRLYFASVGGMVGLGNIVAVIAAITMGGPGALFWLWVAALCGMLIKYAEVYLGIKFRIDDGNRGHHGGPMIYLQRAFKTKWVSQTLPLVYCALLAIYGVEISQFVIVVDVMADTFSVYRPLVIASVLLLTLYGGFGGLHRLANISTALMPPFIIGYMLCCLYVIGSDFSMIPQILGEVFFSAFTGHAAVGGFAGSSIMMAMQLGTERAVYSGDLGLGYDSIVQSSSQAKDPKTQASLSIFGVATDGIICTMSILVVLVSGIWKEPGIQVDHAVSTVFTRFFPQVDVLMAILFFVAGYTTLISYLTVGEKAMRYLFPQWGRKIYCVYAFCAFLIFSFLDQTNAMTVMMLSGGFLMLTNLAGIWKLRHEIEF